MNLALFNTVTRREEIFTPLKKGRVGLYTCGPTVYNYAHLGNLRTYIFEDILKRTLVYTGHRVTHIMNITDVGHLTSDADEGEDKVEKGARREGKSAWDIAKFYEAAFLNDLTALNIIKADKFPRATQHIKQQVALIKKLEKKGFTYRTADGIYFDTSQLAAYGALANLQKQDLRAGARVDVGDKKNITDFALWKFSPALAARQMEWPSPWGVGFPGWHIECSAMAEHYLGVPFDIHCGGIDHIPVHHTNEIAQTMAATGKPLANYWLHGEFLLMGSDKMAKSGDNFVTLRTLKEYGVTPLAFRYFALQTHYRKPLTFSWQAVRAAQNGLEHLYKQVKSLSGAFKLWPVVDNNFKTEFIEKLSADLNTPQALVTVQKVLKSGLSPAAKRDTLLDFDEVLGLDLKNVRRKTAAPSTEPANIAQLVAEREAARQNKDWEKSDSLRAVLEAAGYEITDTPTGAVVTRRTK